MDNESKTPEPEVSVEAEAEVIAGEPEVEEENALADEYKDRLLRLAAEFDNFKKRNARERETLVSDTRFNLFKDFLPVLDNLQRAAAQPCSDEAYSKGVGMIVKQFTDLLAKHGVEEIDALNKPFDPNLHNAVMHAEDETQPQNTIVEVFRAGYAGNGKVIREAMVKVVN